MAYILGTTSRQRLGTVHHGLVGVVKRAIEITSQDFIVLEGIRTEEEHADLLRLGATKTRLSLHLRQTDGLSHAVDLVPFIHGRARWEHSLCCAVAEAMKSAAEELGVGLHWGGSWTRLDGLSAEPEVMVEEHVARQRRQGRRSRIDAQHYELVV